MATITDAFSGRSNFRGRLVVVDTGSDIANNRSPIDWDLYIDQTSGADSWWLDSDMRCQAVVNGVEVYDAYRGYDFRDYNTLHVAGGTINVTHNADGRKTLSFSFQFTARNGATLGNAAKSDSIALDRIPRGPRVRHSGTWENTVAYVRVGGVWKIAIPYVRQSGTWKIAGG